MIPIHSTNPWTNAPITRELTEAAAAEIVHNWRDEIADRLGERDLDGIEPAEALQRMQQDAPETLASILAS